MKNIHVLHKKTYKLLINSPGDLFLLQLAKHLDYAPAEESLRFKIHKSFIYIISRP